MGRITIDDATRDKLTTATSGGLVELCDSAGNVVGYFTPRSGVAIEPKISEEEIELRRSEGEVYTLGEVMDHLRSL